MLSAPEQAPVSTALLPAYFNHLQQSLPQRLAARASLGCAARVDTRGGSEAPLAHEWDCVQQEAACRLETTSECKKEVWSAHVRALTQPSSRSSWNIPSSCSSVYSRSRSACQVHRTPTCM